MFQRSDALPYLRERWIDTADLMLAILENAPVLGLLEKSNSAMPVGGRYMKVPLLRVGAQGRSADYAKAVANAVGSKPVDFQVQYVSNYQAILLTGDVVDDMNGDENAITEALDHETKAAIANMRKDLQQQLFGNAGGARGRVGAIGAGLAGANCRITLKNPSDSKFFEEGMKLAASANDGTAAGHALRDGGDVITITGVNKMLGYLEFAADVTGTIAGLVANDYLFADGDFKSKMSGFRGWIPEADPVAGDSFHGVDRTAGVQILSGLRYDATGKPIEQALVDGSGYAEHYDALFDLLALNPIRQAKLKNSLGADRANRVTKLVANAGKATISYEGVMVATAFGEVPCVSDPGCGIDEGLGLKKRTWIIGHVGEDLVHIVQDDGNRIRRPSTVGDNWQLDVKSRGNIACHQPGENVRFTFSSI